MSQEKKENIKDLETKEDFSTDDAVSTSIATSPLEEELDSKKVVKEVILEEGIDRDPLEDVETSIQIKDYLDPSILDMKTVSVEELEKYDESTVISEKLNDQYEQTFADIKQQEVVAGSVVKGNIDKAMKLYEMSVNILEEIETLFSTLIILKSKRRILSKNQSKLYK